MSDIAETLSRHKGTISREIFRNSIAVRRGRPSGGTPRVYDSLPAHRKSLNRRRQVKYLGMRVEGHDELRIYVIAQLKRGLSPEAISGRMRIEKKPFYAGRHAIYQFLYSPRGQRYCCFLRSHRYSRRKRRGPKTKRTLIPNRMSIHDRPDIKTEYGHFEADTIVSGKRTGSAAALSTLYEPKAMFTDARKIPSLSPQYHTRAQSAMLKKWETVRSVTQDNGIENAHHEKHRKKFNAGTYFCDPHSPWQKPGIENANKLIRRTIPKGADISLYSAACVRNMIRKLNNAPRKALGWKTPNEVAREMKLLKKQYRKNST